MNRLLFFFLIVLVACEQQSTSHPVFKYYPSDDVFEDGFVNKYYRHYYPKNKDTRAATEITYSMFRKEGDRIFIDRYNAGFDLAGVSELYVSGADVFTEKLVDIRRMDTLHIEIVSPLTSRWTESVSEPFIIRYVFGERLYLYTENQLQVYDTLIDGKEGKVFVIEGEYRNEKTREITTQFTDTTIYLADLGYYGSCSDYDTYRFENELIEQMSVEEFERRAEHSKHRIAWIDPENTIDTQEDFNICGHERFIADYYNSTPDGAYIHGKRALLDTVFNNLDEAKMMEQNGMLTFRFVVNCEGKAGRFTVDGYDFMYQPIKFEKETIDHLYEMLRKLKEWRPVVIEEETRDAYFYITYKIENGKITDILP